MIYKINLFVNVHFIYYNGITDEMIGKKTRQRDIS